MYHKMTFATAVTASFMLAGAACAQSRYDNMAVSGSGGWAAAQGNPAGTEGNRTMGGNPAEYDTSLENGAGLGETAAFPHGTSPAGASAGRVGHTGR